MTDKVELKRIRFLVANLDDEKIKPSDRLLCWRLLLEIAQDGWEEEVEQLESLSSVKADPAVESLAGELVE